MTHRPDLDPVTIRTANSVDGPSSVVGDRLSISPDVDDRVGQGAGRAGVPDALGPSGTAPWEGRP